MSAKIKLTGHDDTSEILRLAGTDAVKSKAIIISGNILRTKGVSQKKTRCRLRRIQRKFRRIFVDKI